MDGGTFVGHLEGDSDTSNGTVTDNLIEGIVVGSGQNLVQFNFCEHPGAELHGLVFIDGPAFETEDGNVPDGFRSQRDGIFQQGVDTPLQGVRVFLYFYIDPDNGFATPPRQVTLGEVDASFYDHLDSSNPDTPIFVETDANGEYWFQGLPAGSYTVLEQQPGGVIDANEVVGTTNGFAVNGSSDNTPSRLVNTFSGSELMDTLNNICLLYTSPSPRDRG